MIIKGRFDSYEGMVAAFSQGPLTRIFGMGNMF